MSKDYKAALADFQATLPALSEQSRPDLTPELRALLIAMAPVACDGLLSAIARGPERLKAIRFLFDTLGVSTAPTAVPDAGNEGSSKSPDQ